eukprot:3597021-Alexandrium_andersonii.AAC.1
MPVVACLERLHVACGRDPARRCDRGCSGTVRSGIQASSTYFQIHMSVWLPTRAAPWARAFWQGDFGRHSAATEDRCAKSAFAHGTAPILRRVRGGLNEPR